MESWACSRKARRNVSATVDLSVLLITMGTHKAFEDYVDEAFGKKAGSKVMDRSKEVEVVAYTSVCGVSRLVPSEVPQDSSSCFYKEIALVLSFLCMCFVVIIRPRLAWALYTHSLKFIVQRLASILCQWQMIAALCSPILGLFFVQSKDGPTSELCALRLEPSSDCADNRRIVAHRTILGLPGSELCA